MPERMNIFISSTARDLGKYRPKVKEAILTQAMFPIAMEEFQPSRANALQTCYNTVQTADAFIGIYAHRSGYCPTADHSYITASDETRHGDGMTSITHLEYLWALERDIPLLLFVLAEHDEDGEPMAWAVDHIEDEPGKTRLRDFKAHIGAQHIIKTFTTPDDLYGKVASALASLPAKATPTLPRRRCDFYKHVQTPPNYVKRAGLIDELRHTLLGEGAVAVTSGMTYTPKHDPTALHGIGGIGKSVMARALCDEPLIQQLFPDGILWATLGNEVRDTDIERKLRDWVTALGGAVVDAASLEQVREEVARLLADRACLLIIDDVWRYKQAEAFMVGGAGCRVLLTTRDAEIARALNADVHPIPPMSEAEAVRLLDDWAKDGLATAGDLKRQIVHRLARLPLAVKLAGAQLQRGNATAWLATFDARKLKSARPEDAHDSLSQTFGMSLDALDAGTRHLYNALTIFREDEDIHEAAVQSLSAGLAAIDTADSTALIDDLAARALLETLVDDHRRAVKLHDLLRDFMAAELGAAGAQAAHAALLGAYGDGNWHTLPDDGYIYTHLGYHLRAAGRRDELYALLTADRAWLDASYRVLAGDHGYAADVEMLIAGYADPLTPEQVVQLAALWAARQVVHARVSSYTDQDLEIMVLIDLNIEKNGRRTAEAINAARLRAEPKDRVTGLLTIEKTLREGGQPRGGLLEEAQRTIEGIRNDFFLSTTLYSFVVASAQAGQFDIALKTAREIREDVERVHALSAIATALAQTDSPVVAEVLNTAYRTAITISGDHRRAHALNSVVTAQVHAGHFDAALRTASIIKVDWICAAALTTIANNQMKAGKFDAAQQIRSSIPDVLQRAPTPSHILTEAAEAKVTLNAASEIEDNEERASTLSIIASALAQAGSSLAMDAFDAARKAASTIASGWWRDSVLSDIASALAQAGQFDAAQQTADTITDDQQRRYALHNIASALAQAGQFDAARQTASTIADDRQRGYALRNIASALAQAGQFGVAQQTASTIADDRQRGYALRDIASALAQAGQFGVAQQTASTIADYRQRGYALRDIASALAQAGQFDAAQQTANTIADDRQRVDALCAIASALAQASDPLASEMLNLAQQTASTITDDRQRVYALRNITRAAAQAGNPLANEVLAVAQETISTIADERRRADALVGIAMYQAETRQFDAAQKTANTIAIESPREYAFAEIAITLAEAGRFDAAHKTANTIADDRQRGYALRAIASALAEAHRYASPDGAFATLGLCEPDEFIQAIAEWSPAFEAQERGLSVRVLRECVRIIVWVQPAWGEVAAVLGKE
jgi:hypothetical protein